ncbi:LptF/LptG family permease [Candidatus Sumerlaeota bacterium]|nr:LptF/LptG family permease [Candidatus Sumerlaeota bacterium]
MKLLTRYLLKELFYYFLIIMGIFAVIILAKEMYDTRDEILDEKPAMIDVAQYIMLRMPQNLTDAIPLVSMFAVLFTIGLMAKNREIIAMVGAGVSFHFLLVPVAIYGLTISATSFILTEFVNPITQNQSDYIYEVVIKKGNAKKFGSNDDIFRKGAGERFYIMANFNSADKTMTRPSILDLNKDGTGIAQRIEARSAKIVAGEDGKTRYWEFEKAQRWTFGPDGKVSIERFDQPLRIQMEEKLESFFSKEKNPEEMKIEELRDYCDILQHQKGNAALPKYQTYLNAKFALPLSCLLLALIGFAIAADLQNRRFVLVFTAGLGFGMLYYLGREAFLGMGKSGFLSHVIGDTGPAVAAWTMPLLFAAIAIVLVRRLTVVH